MEKDFNREITVDLDRYEDLLHSEENCNILRQLAMMEIEKDIRYAKSHGFNVESAIRNASINTETVLRIVAASTFYGYISRALETENTVKKENENGK